MPNYIQNLVTKTTHIGNSLSSLNLSLSSLDTSLFSLSTTVVFGPASATDNAFPIFDGSTGKRVKNSTITNPAPNQIGGISTITANTSSGLLFEAANGTDIGTFGVGNTANVSWSGNHSFITASANTIASFNSTKTLQSLTTATYPNLTELSHLKGVTSSIQSQLNNLSIPIFCRTGSDQSFASVSAFSHLDDFSVNLDIGTWQIALHIEAINTNGDGNLDWQLYSQGSGVATQIGVAISPDGWPLVGGYTGWQVATDIISPSFASNAFDVGNMVHQTTLISVSTAGAFGVRIRQTPLSVGALSCIVYGNKTYIICTKLNDVTP